MASIFGIRLLSIALVMFSLFSTPARAVDLLRDADIEYALRQLASPILSAAGLNANQVKILLVDDNRLNAFVVDARHIFIHSGLMQRVDSAAELQAVIAHEAAHITNGHITRRLGNIRAARTAAGLGLALAVAAGAAGNPEAATALAAGTQGSAKRLFLSHTRAEESAADISSVRYLLRAGVDPQGAVDVQELFRGQDVLSAARQDPYNRTHPLTTDRLRALKGLVAGNKGKTRDSSTADYWFARARGKLSAFKRAPSWTLRRAPEGPTRDIRLMREAVAYHRQSKLQRAIKAIDGALAIRPSDPFYMELKGQILLESRQFKSAVALYNQAARAAPRQALILGGLGRAHLAAGNPKAALQALESGRGRDFSDARILRDLAVAYAKTGNNGMASLVTAERYALQGRLKDARIHATRAEGLLARGSGPWQRAQDVISAANRVKRR